MVVVFKRPCAAKRFVEGIVGGERSAGPVVYGVSVESVSARFRAVVNLSARLTAILSGVSVADNGDFLEFVAAQQQVAGARVVQVQESVIVIVAVDGKEVRGSRQAESAEVAVAAARRVVHRHARRSLCDIGDVAARVRNVLNRTSYQS